MEIGSKETSKELTINHLKTLFLKKGYPERYLKWERTFLFTYKNFEFLVEITLTVEDEKPLLILYYHPSKQGLSSFERPFLSVARLFFSPPPYFLVLTNLEDFILIEVYTHTIKKGDEKVLPVYKTLKSYQPPFEKAYSRDIEEKILAFYLSGG